MAGSFSEIYLSPMQTKHLPISSARSTVPFQRRTDQHPLTHSKGPAASDPDRGYRDSSRGTMSRISGVERSAR